MTRPKTTLPLLLVGLAALAGCGDGDRGADAGPASNTVTSLAPTSFALAGPNGAARGSVEVSEDPTGVMIRIAAIGLEPGAHGVHLHMIGKCDGPRFESAGSHWNPTNRKHGRDNPEGAHAGDLANLNVGPDGRGSSQLLVAGVTLGQGAKGLANSDGTSLVIHAQADDYKTDPSGNSGDRVACAVVEAAQ